MDICKLKRTIVLSAFCLLSFCSGEPTNVTELPFSQFLIKDALADVPSPKTELEGTLDAVIKVVEGLQGDKNTLKRRTELRKIINPRFDFEETAKRCLGSKWKDLSQSQQDEFVKLFSEMLVQTYISKIETVRSGMVKVLGEEVQESGNKAIVRTTAEIKGESVPIDYKLMLRGDTWRVYDVTVENIGLVANYRSEFAAIIRKEGIEGLLQRLRNKQGASVNMLKLLSFVKLTSL